MRSRKGPIDRKVISLVLTGGVVAISFSAIFVRLPSLVVNTMNL